MTFKSCVGKEQGFRGSQVLPSQHSLRERDIFSEEVCEPEFWPMEYAH